MASRADSILQDAWRSYNDSDYSEALKLSIAAARQSENPRYALHLACRCLLESQRYNDLLAFLEQIHGEQLHAASVLLGVLNAYMLDHRFDLLHEIYEKLPETHMAGLLALYHSGCAHLGEGDMQAGLAKAILFRDRAKAFWQVVPFLMDDALNVLYRQTVSLGTRTEVEARDHFGSIDVPAIHEVGWMTEKPSTITEPVVHFACADTGYFRSFATHLLGSFDSIGAPVRVHLNVMRPDETIVDELVSIASGLTNVTLDVSTSQTRNVEPSLFASGRFYLLPALLKHYRVPVVTVDADSRITPRVLDLAEMPFDFDVGFYRTDKITPASMFDCAIFVSCPTPGAYEFYDRFLSYIDPLLDGRQRLTWLVDQATIFTLWLYYNEAGFEAGEKAVKLVDLREHSPVRDLYEIVPNAVPEDQKDSIRISNSVSAFLGNQPG